jgi:putative transposase
MIDREHKLSIKRQAEVLAISRGTAYYKPRPVSERDLLLMRKLDELHLNYPFAGSRMLCGLLRQQDVEAGRLHFGTLMKKMGIEAIYRKRNTSKPAPGHRIYPYLLRNVAVTRPNQAWAMDISYIPMARGFVYLAAVWTGSAARYWPGSCRSRWMFPSASKRSKRRFPGMKNRRSSTPTRAVSSPARPSPSS